MPSRGPSASEAVRFYESLRADFNTARELHWQFLLANAEVDRVEPLMRSLQGLGFHDVEPLFDEKWEGRFLIWFAEKRTHSAESFAARVAEVEAFAADNGLVLSDFSAGRE
jgi:hypothetical protein